MPENGQAPSATDLEEYFAPFALAFMGKDSVAEIMEDDIMRLAYGFAFALVYLEGKSGRKWLCLNLTPIS